MTRAILLALLTAPALLLLDFAQADTPHDTAAPAHVNFLLEDPADARDTASTWYRNHVPGVAPDATSTPQHNAAIQEARLGTHTGDLRRHPVREARRAPE